MSTSADRPVPYSLTARAEALLSAREPESGCLLAPAVLHAMPGRACTRPPGTAGRLLAELTSPEPPESEAGL